MKKLTIVMPALNEEQNITEAMRDSLKALDELNIDGEIVAINDGSRDRTSELIRQMASDNKDSISFIDHKIPQGIGACFWEGVDAARGELIVMLPGDNENDPREILRYLKVLDDVDIVAPFVYNKEIRSFLRNSLSYIYRLIINTTFNTSFNYTNGTIVYRRSVLKDVGTRCSSFFHNTYTLVTLVKKGYLFAEVPYRLRERPSGRSKALKPASFLDVTRDYFRLIKEVYFEQRKKAKGLKIIQDSVSFKRFV